MPKHRRGAYRNSWTVAFAALLATASLGWATISPTHASSSHYSDASGSFPELSPNQGRLIFFRPSQIASAGQAARIKINSSTVTFITNDTAVRIDHIAEDVEIAVDAPVLEGSVKFPLKIEGGKEYFVELAPDGAKDGSLGLGALPYLLSTYKPDVTQYCGGGWCAGVIEKEAAMPKLENLTLEPPDPNYAWWW